MLAEGMAQNKNKIYKLFSVIQVWGYERSSNTFLIVNVVFAISPVVWSKLL